MSAKIFKLLKEHPRFEFKEIKAHFEAHPELWDKNHPDFGKGLKVVDYISLLPPEKLTPEQKEANRKVREDLVEFMRTNRIVLTTASTLPARFCPDCYRTQEQGLCDGCENSLFVPGPNVHLDPCDPSNPSS